jgi:hypothetical protein
MTSIAVFSHLTGSVLDRASKMSWASCVTPTPILSASASACLQDKGFPHPLEQIRCYTSHLASNMNKNSEMLALFTFFPFSLVSARVFQIKLAF